MAANDCMRVLVVDDNRDLTDTTVIILNAAGFEAAGVYSGEQAIEIAGIVPPRVVLLDIGMPKMDGYELARRLRMLPGMGDAVLICISGFATEKDRRLSREAGCAHHFAKPIDCDELFGLLRQIAGNSKIGATP
jgi:DNA-binding response OmpR family regulator